MSINTRVSKTRKILKLTQQEFADVMNISRQSVNNIENNRHVPGSDLIAKILDKFPQINARWLLTGEGDMLTNTNTDNDMRKNYNEDYKDRLIQLLEEKVEYLTEENKRLKGGDDKQKAMAG
jgi:transcriptional regulator with XRE-family HTH domain